MLNPYVPGGSTSKKGAMPEDPPSRGPLPTDEMAVKPTVTVPDNTVPMPKQPGTVAQPTTPSTPATRTAVAPNLSSVNVTNTQTASIDPGTYEFTEDRLNNMLSDNSTFMRNARREGLDRATERGGLNSSIAAGLSQREAIRAAAPIAQADAGFTQQRYMAGYGSQLQDILAGNESLRTRDRDRLLASLEDQLAGNQMGRTMSRDTLLSDLESRRINQEADLQGQRDVRLSNLARQERLFDANLTEQARDNETSRSAWLNTQSNLSAAYTQALADQRRSGLNFLDQLGQAFLDDPEVYSPEVVSGMSNFFNSLVNGQVGGSLQDILRDLIGTAPQPVQPVTQPVGG